MDVAPGEIIHMDEHGATKFPRNKLSAVYKNCRAAQDMEDKDLHDVRNSATSAEIRDILSGHSYGSKKKDWAVDKVTKASTI